MLTKTLTRPSPATGDLSAAYFTGDIYNALDAIGVSPGEPFMVCAPSRPADDARPGGTRRTDPQTSRVAAKRAAIRTGTQRAVALKIIADAGDHGAHYAEVEQRSGVRGIWKRISELAQDGYIVADGRTRNVPATGDRASVYVATDLGRAAASKL